MAFVMIFFIIYILRIFVFLFTFYSMNHDADKEIILLSKKKKKKDNFKEKIYFSSLSYEYLLYLNIKKNRRVLISFPFAPNLMSVLEVIS
jgi:hypothetical protein